jgi:hypothetical protein
LWVHRASRTPTYRLTFRGGKTTCMSYLFGRGSVERFAGNLTPAARIGPTRRVEAGLALTFQRLLETQDPDQGRSDGLRACGEGDTDGGAAVSLVEIGARGERHTLFLQQRLAP